MQRRAFLAASGAAALTACSSSAQQQPSSASAGQDSTVTTAEASTTSEGMVESTIPRSRPHRTPPATEPFAVGVSSGDPNSQGVTIWTRLAGRDAAPVTGGDADVEWAVARDEAFDDTIASGTATARATDRHGVRVTLDGLPDGWLYYRFRWDGATSITGRTRTTRRNDDRPFRLALLSCQHYEEGWFVAQRGLVDDQPDLILHVGDYIYGRPGAAPVVRSQPVHGPTDLADYRLLYDTYRRDPNLQALHAAAPMVTVWDDHEVSQNDAGTTPNPRRKHAYRAWWEQQAAPIDEPDDTGHTTTHRLIDIDGLARLWMVDGRQYRSDQACDRLKDLPADERCAAVDDPARTMLGFEQEAWLHGGFTDDGRWDLVAQQTVMADMSVSIGGVTGINNDQWDGYAAARNRLVTAAATNPRSVVLSGDIHAAMVNTVSIDDATPGSGASLAEFVAPSATTRMGNTIAAGLQLALFGRSHIHAFAPGVHGYVLLDITHDRLGATYRSVDPFHPTSTPDTFGQWLLTPGSRVPRSV